MQQEQLRKLADQLAAGELTSHEFMLATAPILVGSSAACSDSQGEVSLDLDRLRRCGFPEVIYGTGKSAETIVQIANQLLKREQKVLATRIEVSQAEHILSQLPAAIFNRIARTIRIDPEPSARMEPEEKQNHDNQGYVAILSAGTSDRPVAEEAQETLAWMGVNSSLIQDVGVAGPHRLPERLAEFSTADALVVVAGMEGALPSVVGGYVGCPVFAVPTSVGYGASLGGIAALLSMLNSCAANVAVVNIDAGFKAGYLAGLVATKRS